MRCLQIVLPCLLALLPGLSHAGPWAREAGRSFVSVVPEWSIDDLGRVTDSVSLYAEHGLGHRLTMGADVFAQDDSRVGFAFLRRTLTAPDATWQWAVTGGLGQRRNPAGSQALTVAGISAGRSFSSRWGPGWADTYLQGRFFDGETALKLDTTLGIAPRDGWRLFGQVQIADYPGADTSARLQLSSVHRVSSKLFVELSAVNGLVEDERSGLRLGLWSEF